MSEIKIKMTLICSSFYDATQKRAIHVWPQKNNKVIIGIDCHKETDKVVSIEFDEKEYKNLVKTLYEDTFS